jgi:DnaK suppressor protein
LRGKQLQTPPSRQMLFRSGILRCPGVQRLHCKRKIRAPTLKLEGEEASRMIPAKKLEQYRRALEARIAELDRSASSAEREARTLGTKTSDPMDQAALESQKQAALHRASAARQLRKNVMQALERIRQGTYGECRSCGGEIEAKRLEALPFARYCIKCQEEMERK